MFWQPVAFIVAGWVLNYGLNGWGLQERGPDAVSNELVRRVALCDAILVLVYYGASAWGLATLHGPLPRARAATAGVVVLLLLLEVLYRIYGAALSMGGDIAYRISQALGLGIVGYGVLPAVGFCAGLGLGWLWRNFHSP